MVAAAALVCSVLASLTHALHAATARPARHGSCRTLLTLTRRPLSVSRALHVLSSCVLCLVPPVVDLLEALDRCCVCTRRACCFCLRIYRTSTASVELRPRGWRAVAFPRSLHVLSCWTWLVVRCYTSSCVSASYSLALLHTVGTQLGVGPIAFAAEFLK